jgi:hypothetical protein
MTEQALRCIPYMNPGNDRGMTHPAPLSLPACHRLAVKHVPVGAMIDRLRCLVTAHAKGLHMARGARLPLCQGPDPVAPDPPETRVALRAVQLVTLPALVVNMTGTAVIDMTGFYPVPCPSIGHHHGAGPETVPPHPLSGGLMI